MLPIFWLININMALDNTKNFAKTTVSTVYDNVATSIVLASGHGAKLPTVPFNVTWWDATTYADPSDDPNVEIVRVTNIATDTLTVTRGQEGTTASTKNTASKTYKLIAGLTAKVFNTDIPAITGSANPVTVVYASKIAGINLNGSLSANTGTDDKALIQAVLNTATATNPLRLIMDGVALIDTTTVGLVVKSNTDIIGLGWSTGFSWKGSANANQKVLLTNANPIGTGAITDKNISLRNFAINGNRAIGHGGQVGTFSLTANSLGVFLASVRFVGVANVVVEDYLTIGSPSFSLHFANATNFHTNRTRFQNLNGDVSSDGVHVNGPASNFTIRNVSGTTGDDLVALNADDGHLPGSTGNIGVYGDNSLSSTVKQGIISKCLVDGVYPEGCFSAFRLLSATSRLDCTIRNVHGTVYDRIAYIDNDAVEIASLGGGNFGTVILENINVVQTNTSAATSLELGATFQYLKLGLIVDNFNTTGPLITTTTLAIIKEFVLDVYVTSTAGLPAPVMRQSLATISAMSLTGRFDAGSVGTQSTNPILLVSGGTLETLQVSMLADRINNLVSFTTASTTDTVLVGPGRHLRAASGQGTLNIASGIVVKNVVTAGFATKLLKSGSGTITNSYVGVSTDSVSDPVSSTLQNNLVAFWHMTEGSGLSRADSTSNGHNLANTGTVSQSAGTPQAGNVATFPGSGASYLDTAGAAFTVSAVTGYTFSMWVRMGNISANHSLMGKTVSGGTYEFILYWDNNAHVFSLNINGQHVDATTLGLGANIWHFVCGGWDPIAGKAFIAVNNAADALSPSVVPRVDSGVTFQLGHDGPDALTYLGDMAHVGFWNRVLTSGERTTLYNSGTFFDVL